jgi:hypothetical protein
METGNWKKKMKIGQKIKPIEPVKKPNERF